MRLLCLPLTIIILMGGMFGPNFKEYQAAPDAVVYWRDKDKRRVKSQSEVKEFINQLDRKIEGYIRTHPELSEFIKHKLQVFQTVHKGMTKEQVLLLLDEPAKKEVTSEYGADEKWIYITYHPYAEDHLYFKDGIVIKIFGFQTGNVL